MKQKTGLLILALSMAVSTSAQERAAENNGVDSFNSHRVMLDDQSKIISWITPQSVAYDHFLRQRWEFIKTKVPYSPGPAPRSSYPQYYFYCAYRVRNGKLVPDTWMNDIGERIPNWFESARLYYAYSGDTAVMKIVKDLVSYVIDHGTSPASFSWPGFPYTTSNAGETEFKGFTSGKRFALHEVQVDHAGDMGLTYYRLYQYTGETKFKNAAIAVANTLAAKARTGTAEKSVWPYRVVMSTGKPTAEYGANWFGCYALLKNLADARIGNVPAYRTALEKARTFILEYPMKTGFWTDGHTDTDVNSHTYKSNMSASNATLYLLDHPEFDPAWKEDIPMLIKWTEKYFINRSAPGEPSNQWGANIVGEQDSFLFKMDYQTARYAAECAGWYAKSGDETYKEKAYRSLNWVTYCNNEEGLAFESPLSKDISNWWSDCYGEGPRMFYHAFAAVPEWAPPEENHILYAEAVLKNVEYLPSEIKYTATGATGTEYLHLAFKPETVTVNGTPLSLQTLEQTPGYTLKKIGNKDYAVTLKRMKPGKVVIAGPR